MGGFFSKCLTVCCNENTAKNIETILKTVAELLELLSRISRNTKEFLTGIGVDSSDVQDAIAFLNNLSSTLEAGKQTADLLATVEIPKALEHLYNLSLTGNAQLDGLAIIDALEGAQEILRDLINKGVKVDEALVHLKALQDVITKIEDSLIASDMTSNVPRGGSSTTTTTTGNGSSGDSGAGTSRNAPTTTNAGASTSNSAAPVTNSTAATTNSPAPVINNGVFSTSRNATSTANRAATSPSTIPAVEPATPSMSK